MCWLRKVPMNKLLSKNTAWASAGIRHNETSFTGRFIVWPDFYLNINALGS